MNSRRPDAVGGGAPAKKKGIPWWGWALIGLGVSVPACVGVVSALAIYGTAKYVRNAKSAEGRVMTANIAKGIAACAGTPGSGGALRGLPGTSVSIPHAAPPAKKYMSRPTEWSSQEAFACAGFSLSEPQYFAYQWQRRSATSGMVLALADLDGDGNAEVRFEQAVECTASGCSPGALVEAGAGR